MYINEYFKTPIWSEEKPEFVKSLNKASDKYIKASKKMPDSKKYLKQFGDFGRSWHSTPLLIMILSILEIMWVKNRGNF